jgi:hypothetical protein
MSVLDLQGMTSPAEELGLYGKRPPKGGGSGGSNPSTISLLLCAAHSTLSLLLC